MNALSPHVYLFVITAAAGLAVILIGTKFTEKIRAAVQTTGLMALLTGLCGVLYHFVPLYLFVTLSSLLVGLIVLADPLKLKVYLSNPRQLTLIGRSLIAIAIVFSLATVNRFPPFLWLIPLVLYLMLYLIPSLKERRRLVTGIVWVILLVFLSYNGLLIYQRLNPAGIGISFGPLSRYLNGKGGSTTPSDTATATATPPVIATSTTTQTATHPEISVQTDIHSDTTEETSTESEITEDTEDGDDPSSLQDDFDTLKKLYADEVKKTEALEKEIEALKKQIKSTHPDL